MNVAADAIANVATDTVVDTTVNVVTAPVVEVTPTVTPTVEVPTTTALDTSSASGDSSLVMFDNDILNDSGVEVQKD